MRATKRWSCLHRARDRRFVIRIRLALIRNHLSFCNFRPHATFVGLNYVAAFADSSFGTRSGTAATAIISLVVINVRLRGGLHLTRVKLTFSRCLLHAQPVGGIVLELHRSMIFDGILQAYGTSSAGHDL